VIMKAVCPSDTCDLAHRPGGGGGPQKGVHTPLFLSYCDPDNAAYDALGLKKGVGATFFTIDTPLAILARAQKDNAKDLLEATKRWKPWLPPKSDQGLQQGGAFVFEGEKLLFQHYDASTGAHTDLDTLLNVALKA